MKLELDEDPQKGKCGHSPISLPGEAYAGLPGSYVIV
jgi:hypothetical protein